MEISIKKGKLKSLKGGGGDLDELTYVLLHSPIRDVYLCIQGFDSRLACRICNNTVQSSIRADGLSAHRERTSWRQCDRKRKKERKREGGRERERRGTGEEKEGERKDKQRKKEGNCRETDSAEVLRVIPV